MHIEFWHWWGVALVLTGIEMLMPGAMMIWLGAAAALVGLVLLVWPDLPWTFQLLCFGLLAPLTVAASRFWLRRHPIRSADPALNRRGAFYVGRIVVLETAIVNGRGRARVGDGLWTVEGADLPAGTPVLVIGSDGAVLRVEQA
jgi:membrane protein implicated in regulation of membrane protease activity